MTTKICRQQNISSSTALSATIAFAAENCEDWKIRVRTCEEESNSRIFKVMCQQIQGLNTEEKGLEISKIWRWIVQNATLMSFKQLCQIWACKSIQQNVHFECQTISENIQKLKQEKFKDFQVILYKFQDIQGHSRTFKFCTNPE